MAEMKATVAGLFNDSDDDAAVVIEGVPGRWRADNPPYWNEVRRYFLRVQGRPRAAECTKCGQTLPPSYNDRLDERIRRIVREEMAASRTTWEWHDKKESE